MSNETETPTATETGVATTTPTLEVAVPALTSATKDEPVIIAQTDFDELLELEKSVRQTEEQLNKVSGTIYRLTKDQEFFLNQERSVVAQVEQKRKELIKRYKIDDTRRWQVDINERRLVYLD